MANVFPTVIGQAPAKDALHRGLRAGRLVGSFLLVGPRGVGRALLARELAKALNCRGPAAAGEDAAGDLPCGACGPCRRFASGNFADFVVLELEGKASIGIDRVKALLEELALAPVEGGRRVFLIDPAGALTEDAQNALLKGLEEPPERAALILIAGSEDELLPTIVSRCLAVRLGELAPDEVREVLARHGLSGEEAERRARWSGGSPGRALAEDAPQLVEAAGRLVDALASGAAYDDPLGVAGELAGYVDRGPADNATRRERLLELIRVAARGLRDALVRQVAGLGGRAGAGAEASSAAGGPGLDRLSGADEATLARLAALPRGRLEASLDRLEDLTEQVLENVNPTLVLEGLVVDLGAGLAPRRPAVVPPRGAAR